LATRLYLTNSPFDPSSPFGFDSGNDLDWEEIGDGTGGSMLMARAAEVPGGDVMQTYSFPATVLQNGDRHHYQFLSPPLAAGNVFDAGVTFKCQILGRESAANDNIMRRVRTLKVITGLNPGIDSAILIAFGDAVAMTEWLNSGLRNLSFLTGQVSGATYITVAGDRLKLEIGHRAVGGVSVKGSTRIGFGGGTGDLGENETDTTTTLRAWLEISSNLVFLV